MKRRIVSITGTRSDYGLMRPVHRAIEADPSLELTILVTGMHLLPAFADSLQEIEADGFSIRMMPASPERPQQTAMIHAIANQMAFFADTFQQIGPDIVLLQGDRGEMLAGAIAAAHLNIAVVHMSGGDRSGTIDQPVRDAISKFAHLHLATCRDSASNLAQLGEAIERIVVVGEPALDIIESCARRGLPGLTELGLDLSNPYILAAQHPVTTEATEAAAQMRTTLEALALVGLPVLFTYPNSDTGGAAMTAELEAWRDKPWLKIVPTLGSDRFLAALQHAAVLVGNSSSGILEAPSFRVPAVNIGTRQHGRLRAGNVIDVPHDIAAIRAAILTALEEPAFRARLGTTVNPYGDGHASSRTLAILKELLLGQQLIMKWLYPAGPVLSQAAS